MAVALRYPPTQHEIGVDSYTIHGLADMIVGTGKVGWLATPLSYFGLAPFSYSPGVPIDLAAFESLAGTSGELAALVFSLFFGAILPITAFLFGFAAFRRPSIALLVSFLISTAGGMVGSTTWTVSTRGAFLTITPLALALFVDALMHKSATPRYAVALSLVIATLLFIHAMFILLVPMTIGAFLVYRIVAVEDRLLMHRRNAAKRTHVALLTLLAVGAGFSLLVALGPASDTLTGFPTLKAAILPDNVATRMILQWVTLMGLGIVFLPIGLLRLLKTADRKRSFALCSMALAFLPLALNPVYGLLVSTPMVLLVAAAGLESPKGTKRVAATQTTRGATVAVGVACVLIVVAPMLLTIPRTSGVPCNEPDYIDSQTYNAGLYLRYTNISGGNYSFAWDDHIEAERLETIAGRPSMEPLLSIGDLAVPWLSSRMKLQFQVNTQLMDFLLSGHQALSAQEWLSLAGLGYPYYWGKHTFVLLQSQPDSPTSSQILSFYRTSFAVERCGTGHTPFFDGLSSSSYVTYEDELQRAYWIRGYS